MTQDEMGLRSRAAAKYRLIGAGLMFLALIALEMSFGRWGERHMRDEMADKSDQSWVVQRFIDPANAVVPPPQTATKRLVYISNSHAFTGGRVARHLQGLLDVVCPNAIDIVDLSSAGMFAPEFLQRFVSTLSLQPDGLILAPAYISFSDRMGLARQAETARSMFKPEVFGHLPLGFWRRNYDFGLYMDSFVAQHWKTYRYRNMLRDTWEKPLAQFLKEVVFQQPIRFLETDQYQSWRFPEGFDRNLFQWRLYSSGRSGHMADLKALLRSAKRHEIPVYGFNLPVHWEKEPEPRDAADIDRYRQELGAVFKGSRLYVDYEEIFPKKFTTYDAIHPNWQGARLHALDIVLRLFYQNQLGCETGAEAIFSAFEASDKAISPAYKAALRGPIEAHVRGFRRLDVTEPANARRLLARLISTQVGSSKEFYLLQQLAIRFRYWFEVPFDIPENTGIEHQELWRHAVRTEIERATTRRRYFIEHLTRLQQHRLRPFPLPDLTGVNETPQSVVYNIHDQLLRREEYPGPRNSKVFVLSTEDGVPFSYRIVDVQNQGYERIDVLADGSFLMLRAPNKPLYLPHWMRHQAPMIDFGI